jgi:hypothetical protein
MATPDSNSWPCSGKLTVWTSLEKVKFLNIKRFYNSETGNFGVKYSTNFSYGTCGFNFVCQH